MSGWRLTAAIGSIPSPARERWNLLSRRHDDTFEPTTHLPVLFTHLPRRGVLRRLALPQATRGVGVALSGAVSVCLVCLRERCSGPVATTTTTATAHHNAASSHDSLTESAPENIGEKKLPEMVLFMACSSITISTLPSALLNTQATTTDTAITSTRSDQLICPTTISGRCQNAHSTPRMRLANRAECSVCSWGKA